MLSFSLFIWVTGVLTIANVSCSNWCFNNLCRSHYQCCVTLVSFQGLQRWWWLLLGQLKYQSLSPWIVQWSDYNIKYSLQCGYDLPEVSNTLIPLFNQSLSMCESCFFKQCNFLFFPETSWTHVCWLQI